MLISMPGCSTEEFDLLSDGYNYAEVSERLCVDEDDVRERNASVYHVDLAATFQGRIARHGSPSRLRITDDLGYWFSGLFDGEGHFGVQLDIGRQRVLKAQVLLRRDDAAVTQRIHGLLNCGVLYCHKPSQNRKPCCFFKVQDLRDLREIIVPLFERYPLQSKKATEFDLWKRLVSMRYLETAGGCLSVRCSPDFRRNFDAVRTEIKRIRTYDTPDTVCGACRFRLGREAGNSHKT
jgi:hypothetical protein